MVEDVCHLPGAGRTVLFLSSSPLTLRLRMISSMVVLASHGEVEKALPVVRLATHKLLMSDDAVVRVEFIATTLADKHMTTVLLNFVLVRRWQRHESLVTDISGINPLSLLCFVPPHGSHPATTCILSVW